MTLNCRPTQRSNRQTRERPLSGAANNIHMIKISIFVKNRKEVGHVVSSIDIDKLDLEIVNIDPVTSDKAVVTEPRKTRKSNKKSKSWTEEEINKLREESSFKTYKLLAKELGRTVASVTAMTAKIKNAGVASEPKADSVI